MANYKSTRYFRHYMGWIQWILFEFAQTAINTPCTDELPQMTHYILNDPLSSAGTSTSANIGHQPVPQREVEENESHPRPFRSSEIIQGPCAAQSERDNRSICTAIPACASNPHLSFNWQELSRFMQMSTSNNPLIRTGVSSEEFHAQMAKDVLPQKNKLPPSWAALNETLALMNSRVIFPSVETVHWFSKKMSTDKDPHASLASLHRKCASAYLALSEDIREQNETFLFQTLSPVIRYSTAKLSQEELNMIAQHRSHISMLAKHIKNSPTDITTAPDRMEGQKRIQPPTFKYSPYTPQTQPRLCLCFAVQLLTSGFFSYIPDSYFPVLQNVLVANGTKLVSYMLGPGRVEVFPEFITAFYIIMSDMCTDIKNQKLLAYHKEVVKCLSTDMSTIYKKEPTAQQSHLCQLVTDYYPALHTLSAGELFDESSAFQAATEKASVYWHAFSALAALSIPVFKKSNAMDNKKSLEKGVSSATKHYTLADYFVQLLRLPVANTASLSCWAAVLEALTYAMPSIDVYALMVAHTPPAFAGPLLRCEVVNSIAYVIIVSLWLALEMPHTDSIIANVDAMHTNPACRYKVQLLTRQPVSFFARAPSELLRNICNTLFEHIHIRISKRHRRERLKRKVEDRAEDVRHTQKRKKCKPQINTAAVLPNETTRSWSDEDSEDVANTEVSHTKEAGNYKYSVSTRQINVQDDEEQLSRGETFIGDDGLPLSTLYLNMCIHCRTPDDITEEEIAYLMNNKRVLRGLTDTRIAIANEIPQMQSLNSINYRSPFLTRANKALLQIFGALSSPENSACASASGTSSTACERRQGAPACAGASEASADGSNRADRTVLKLTNVSNRASQDNAMRAYDISWDKYANCKHYVTTLPAFFARQFLPRLADLISTNPFQKSSVEFFKMAGYILDTDGLASNMQLLERTLSNLAAALQMLEEEYFDFENITAELVHKAHPDMPRFVLKSNPAISLPLKDMEQLVQQCVGSNFIDARAYMEISDAHHQLVFRILSAKNFTQAKVMSACEMRNVLMQIVRLLPRECPFVFQAFCSTEQAKIKCTWSPFFRAPPSRASPTIVPDNRIVRAIINTCYSSIDALTNNILVEEWLKLSTWVFTRSAVQSFIASKELLHPVHGNGIGRIFATVIAHCLEDIDLFIASIAEDKAKKTTDAASYNSNADQLIQADSDRNRLCHSLKSRLTELISLPKR